MKNNRPPSSGQRDDRCDDALLHRAGRLYLFAGVPVASFALCIKFECAVKLLLVEIRPQRVAKPQLGIGQVPQQEIADALLAAGANQQVRIRNTRQRQLPRDRRIVDLRWPAMFPPRPAAPTPASPARYPSDRHRRPRPAAASPCYPRSGARRRQSCRAASPPAAREHR